MKKIILTLAVIIISGIAAISYTCDLNIFSKKGNPAPQIIENKKIEVLATTDSVSNAVNQVWVGTFQLIWNDLIDSIIKAPVTFAGYDSNMAKNLNKKEFTIYDISESTYYKKWGLVSKELKQEIEDGIKEKFDETSNILDTLDWTPAKDKYILYAMLKKDFEYTEKFNKLPDANFNGSKRKVKYFGLDEDSTYKQRDSINVLFYNGEDDFAVSLKSKQGDIIYLYRTNDDKTFKNYYEDIKNKTNAYNGKKYLEEIDSFKAPMIDFNTTRDFKELTNKQIKNSDFVISQAIETVQFKMNETGVKLKSEAAIIVEKCILQEKSQPRFFDFNDKYVIFISENGKKPYFALKVTDAEKLQ